MLERPSRPAQYLLYTDGRTSSNFASLLGAGAVVLHQRSTFVQYFEHMLTPWVHFVPIWVERPDDAVDVLAHLESWPQVAASIAQNARAVACGLLQRKHHVEYWGRLLLAYAPLMGYTVSSDVLEERRHQLLDAARA